MRLPSEDGKEDDRAERQEVERKVDNEAQRSRREEQSGRDNESPSMPQSSDQRQQQPYQGGGGSSIATGKLVPPAGLPSSPVAGFPGPGHLASAANAANAGRAEALGESSASSGHGNAGVAASPAPAAATTLSSPDRRGADAGAAGGGTGGQAANPRPAGMTSGSASSPPAAERQQLQAISRRAESPAAAPRAFSAFDMMPSFAPEDAMLDDDDDDDDDRRSDGGGGSSSGGEDGRGAGGGDDDSVVSGSVVSVGSRSGGRASASGIGGGGVGRSSPSGARGAGSGLTSNSTPPPNRGGGSGGVGGAWDFLPGRGFAVSSQSPLSSGQLFGAGGGLGGAGGDTASSVGVGASDLDDDDGGGGGGTVDAWDRRGDRAAREKAHRRARAELKRFAAARKFPTNVGVVQVHSLGRVRPDPGFYSLGRLAPVGFRASRTERAPADQALVHCVMEVVEVPDPSAAASPTDGDETGTPLPPSVPSGGAKAGTAAAFGDAATEGVGAATAAAAGLSRSSTGDGDVVGGAAAAEGAAGHGVGEGGKDNGRESVAVFRVTLSGLRGERGTFEDVSAGRAWRAALRSIGAEVGKVIGV